MWMFSAFFFRLNLIKPWLIIPGLTNPGLSMALFSPSLTPSMTRYDCRNQFFTALLKFEVLVKWTLVKRNLPMCPVGGRCHLHDLHHGSAHRVCGHRADVQRSAQPQRQGCGQRAHEGLSFWCSSHFRGFATARYETPWPLSASRECKHAYVFKW